MRESEYMVRDGKRKIDIHKTIHAFAMAVGRQAQEEDRIKNDKVIKKAILKVFKNNPAVCMNVQTLIVLAAREMNVGFPEYGKTLARIETHIHLNASGYLNVVKGRNGGVFRNR